MSTGSEESPAPCGSQEGSCNKVGQPPRFPQDFDILPGGVVWNASLALLEFLRSPRRAPWLRGLRVLELGSGLGHCAHGLARLGAHVTCTDQRSALPALRASLRELDRAFGEPRALLGGTVRVEELNWGLEGVDAAASSPTAWAADGADPFDLILCAELLYVEEAMPLLLATLEHFCGEDSAAYSVFIHRPFSWNFFALLADSGVLEVEPVADFDACGLEDCFMHRITRRRRRRTEIKAEATAAPETVVVGPQK